MTMIFFTRRPSRMIITPLLPSSHKSILLSLATIMSQPEAQRSYSLKQCHLQILDLSVEKFNDTIENIDDKSFALIRDGIQFAIWQMDTQGTNMSVALTIAPTRCLHKSDYEKVITTLREN